MINISKSDWKLFQDRLPDWQENFIDRVLKDYIKLLKSSGNPSDRFWKLEKRIKEDRKHPGVSMRMEKSETIWNIVSLLRLNVIAIDDLDGFSSGLIEEVKRLV